MTVADGLIIVMRVIASSAVPIGVVETRRGDERPALPPGRRALLDAVTALRTAYEGIRAPDGEWAMLERFVEGARS